MLKPTLLKSIAEPKLQYYLTLSRTLSEIFYELSQKTTQPNKQLVESELWRPRERRDADLRVFSWSVGPSKKQNKSCLKAYFCRRWGNFSELSLVLAGQHLKNCHHRKNSPCSPELAPHFVWTFELQKIQDNCFEDMRSAITLFYEKICAGSD